MLVVAASEQLPVAQARTGEPEAWDTLFRRYQLPLYTYVFELVHREQVTLDIVQETFIAATRYIDGLREDDRFGSWLFGIAHQKCIQHWRRDGRAAALREELEQVPEGVADGPDDWLIRREAEADFMRLLQQLTPPHRAVLLLHFIEDFSLEEIGQITGAAPGTVKSRLHYAKQALRKLWEEKNEDPT